MLTIGKDHSESVGHTERGFCTIHNVDLVRRLRVSAADIAAFREQRRVPISSQRMVTASRTGNGRVGGVFVRWFSVPAGDGPLRRREVKAKLRRTS